MKLIACCTVVLLAAGGAVAAEPDTDQLAKDAIAVVKEQCDVLKMVKDKETAEAALPKLKALAERWQKVEKALQALTPEEGAAFKKKHEAAFGPVGKALEKEFARVESLPDAYAVLRESPLFVSRRGIKEATARVMVKTLETAVQVYKIRHGDYPPDLAVLTMAEDGKPAILEASALKDPWGRPYVYEPNTLDPVSGKPLIYSHGPDPKDPKGRIANFTPEEKKPPKK